MERGITDAMSFFAVCVHTNKFPQLKFAKGYDMMEKKYKKENKNAGKDKDFAFIIRRFG